MEKNNKKKIKVNRKAGLGLLKDTVILENDINSIVCEIDNDALTNFNYNHITAVRLDASEHDFKEKLEKYNNLSSIEILNAQDLDDNKIEVINEKNLDEIHLIFNRYGVLRKKGAIHSASSTFDLNRFNNKQAIKSIKFSQPDNKEMNSVIFLNYLINYEDLNLGIEKYKYIDDIFDNMVNDLDLSSWSEDMMNLIKIANFEINYLEYDPEELEYLETHKDKTQDKEMFNLLKRYNQESLTMILDPNKMSVVDYTRQIKAICANFQDMFLILCIKSGIECYPIDGLYVDENGADAHGWNMIRFQGSYYLIDLTYFDSFDELNELMNSFMKTTDPDDYQKLCNSLLIPLNREQAKDYVSDENLTEIMLGAVDDKDYSNIYGTNYKKQLFKLFGLSTVLTWFILGSAYVFIEAKLNEHKEKERQRRAISSSAIFNSPEGRKKRL